MVMPNVDDVMDWESGEMDPEREIKFFQSLVDSGMAWKLQGCYGRRAKDLLESGEIVLRGGWDCTNK